jgi:hypothetical protein
MLKLNNVVVFIFVNLRTYPDSDAQNLIYSKYSCSKHVWISLVSEAFIYELQFIVFCLISCRFAISHVCVDLCHLHFNPLWVQTTAHLFFTSIIMFSFLIQTYVRFSWSHLSLQVLWKETLKVMLMRLWYGFFFFREYARVCVSLY